MKKTKVEIETENLLFAIRESHEDRIKHKIYGALYDVLKNELKLYLLVKTLYANNRLNLQLYIKCLEYISEIKQYGNNMVQINK